MDVNHGLFTSAKTTAFRRPTAADDSDFSFAVRSYDDDMSVAGV
jgi:hypothetical protein